MDFIEILAVLIVLYILMGLIEQKFLMVSNYIVASDKLGKEFDHTNFIVLADLHNHTFGKKNQRLIARIDRLAPDFILIAGDMINKMGSQEFSIEDNTFSLLESLSKKYKIYYAMGNHEQNIADDRKENQNAENKKNLQTGSYWKDYKRKLEDLGVVFLDNDSTIIQRNTSRLRITGVSISRKYYEKYQFPVMEAGYLNSLAGASSSDAFQILIAHNPIYFKQYADWGADLTVSGHLHGGVVRLPFFGGIVSPQVRLFPKYDAGRFTENGHDLIVSRGLGTHSYMLRLFNPPELVFVQLKKNR